MQGTGKGTLILIGSVFAALVCLNIVVITIGYRNFKKDMFLSETPIVVAMHDPDSLDPTPYVGKFVKPPSTKPATTSAPATATAPASEPATTSAPATAPATKPATALGKKDKPDAPQNTKAEMGCQLQLPKGFSKPLYLTDKQRKDENLLHSYCILDHSFSVTHDKATLTVSDGDYQPREFSGYSRANRLGLLHDLKNITILMEGPVTINSVSGYSLTFEYDDKDGNHLISRQVHLRGPGTRVYFLQATAPAASWNTIVDTFDSSISTFVITATAPTTAPGEALPAPEMPGGALEH